MKKIKESNSKYHRNKIISGSGLRTIYDQSIYYFLKEKRTETDAMRFGTAVHTLLLEGREKFRNDYFFMPKLDARLKKNKELIIEYKEKSQGKVIWDTVKGREFYYIYQNFISYPLALNYTTGIVELSHYDTFKDCSVKVRPDCYEPKNWVADVKTSRDITQRSFRSEIRRRHYDLQATFYCDVLGIDPKNFRFIAVRNVYPFDCEVYSLNEDMISSGRYKYNIALNQWKDYLKTGNVTSFYSENRNEDGSIIL